MSAYVPYPSVGIREVDSAVVLTISNLEEFCLLFAGRDEAPTMFHLLDFWERGALAFSASLLLGFSGLRKHLFAVCPTLSRKFQFLLLSVVPLDFTDFGAIASTRTAG